jgi:hypothetical protein
LADSEARTGLSVATIEADISVRVGDEGEVAQGLGDVDGAVFTVAVVEGVGGSDNTVQESIDGLVEGPSATDNVSGSVVEEIEDIASIKTITSD